MKHILTLWISILHKTLTCPWKVDRIIRGNYGEEDEKHIKGNMAGDTLNKQQVEYIYINTFLYRNAKLLHF